MNVTGNYDQHGYLHVRKLVPAEVARAFLGAIKEGLGPEPLELSTVTAHGAQLKRPAFEIYSHQYQPMNFFLWALTPTISELVGRDLLPTYNYFRIYREGDVCLIHSDRPSCEHSISLTLDYSDGEVWNLEVASGRTPPAQPLAEDWGTDAHASVGMAIGDAVLYQGVHHRHGRVTPNRNAWSAHLFLHFVERGGPYEEYAFDKKLSAKPVNFEFV
jgi:hypothetical protein